MSLDLILGVILALCFVVGVLRGLLRQIVSIAALLVGFTAAWIVSSVLRPLAGGSIPFSAISCAAVFIAIYLILVSLGKRLMKTRALAFSKGTTDRLLGGALSLVEGIVAILILVWLFDYVGKEWLSEHRKAEALWSESLLVRRARAHNALAGLEAMRRVKGLFVAMKDTEARDLLRSQPAFAAFTANPRYRAVRNDSALDEDLRRKNWIGALGDPRMRSLIADGEFWRDFLAVRWEAALEKPPPKPTEIPAIPSPTPPPTPTEAPVATPTPAVPPDLSTVTLKSGSVLQGKLLHRDAQGLLMDVLLDGGTLKMSISAEEIERIEPTPDGSPSGR